MGSGKVSHFTGGGVAFPPIPRSYAMKVNKKVKAQAYRMALGDLVAGGTVRVLAGTEFAEPSTKRAAQIISKAGIDSPVVGARGPGRDRGAQELPQPCRHTGAHQSATLRCRTISGLSSLLLTEAAVSFLESGSQGRR